MAGEDENLDIEEDTPTISKGKKAAKHDSKEAALLEKVTDYVEEVEMTNENLGDVSVLVSDMKMCVLLLSNPLLSLDDTHCWSGQKWGKSR